ncbi:hypothetical protein C8K30_102339 [Promicromonospora sp. AC04]|uniref:DUF456 domain-containing protein n=1 Tax=Promicromonospora sp. AC04 TaxID=2135723 RepID=UPI000D378F98|nr:DUF456 domain-containing protein [Promicromonospora sp. AC04]PUB29961.1 hypothetical protein C8K30_102339 [Promicromonospora sp. AC04]
MDVWAEVLVGVAILAGLVGIVVQVLPGAVLVLGGILVWAIFTGGVEAWVVFSIAAVAIAVAEVAQWILAGKHMRKAEVPVLTLAVGGIAGIIGFFVVPVIGLFLFFVAAIFLLEWARRRDVSAAWGATKAAVQATLITIGVQLAGSLIAAGAWVVGLFLT